MPKQYRPVVEKPKPAKKAKKTKPTNPVGAAPTLPTPHAAQLALIEEGKCELKAHNAVLVVGKHNEPNTGKTRAAGALARWWAGKRVKAGETPLVIFGATTVALAVEHAVEVGVHSRFAGFTLDERLKTSLARELKGNGHAAIAVTRTMLHKLVNAGNAKFGKPQLLASFAAEVGATAVCVVVDEAHQLYKNPTKMPLAFEKLREQLDNLALIGLTATPGFDRKACRDGALSMFDVMPPVLEYADEDLASLKGDLQTLPKAPTEWTTVDVGNPVGNKACAALLTELHACIVDVFMAASNGEEAKITKRDARNHKMSEIIATLAHGTDGGVFVDKITAGEVKVRKASGGAPFVAKESVLVAHKSRAAEVLHLAKLREVIAAKRNSHPLTVVDLGVELNPRQTNKLGEAQRAMLASFKAQVSTTVGFLTKRQHAGNNDFAKVATTVCAIGFGNDDDGLRQVFGRVGRMGVTPEDDELVPVAYRALHLTCACADKVANMEAAPAAASVKLPSDVAKLLKDHKELFGYEYEEIYANAQKLVLADEYLKTKGALARDYLDKERVDKEEREEGEEEEEDEEDEQLFGEEAGEEEDA